MCGGGREAYDIEEAERMEQEELKHKETSTNVQISVVGDMLVDSEPELFGRGTAVLMENRKNKSYPELDSLMERYYHIARWHGAIQAQFNKEFGI